MSRSRALAAWHRDDWPLVVFTTLAIAGSGSILSPAAALIAGRPAAEAARLVAAGALLLAAGLAVSLAHLGRPLRAPRAMANLCRSRLSAEIVLALATLIAAAVSLAWPSLPGPGLVAGLAAGACLVSLGLVYALPGQHTWLGAAAAGPVTTALPLAVIGFAAVSLDGGAADGTWRTLTTVLLALDLAVFAARVRRVLSVPSWCQPVRPALFRHRIVLLGLRATFLTIVPLVFALTGMALLAAMSLAAGILVDRVGFYGLAVRRTAEAEVAAAEKAC